MASEIRVNKINSRTGVGTITLSPTGVDFTGIATVATLKATTGIVTTFSATGNATVGGTLGVTGETTFATHVNLGDSDKLKFGASGDLQIYHDGNNSYVDDTGSGDLYLRGYGSVFVGKYTGETCAQFISDGAVDLYHNNSKKLETTSGGIDVTGMVQCDQVRTGDDEKIQLGDSQDFRIYHDGSTNIIDGHYHPIELRHQSEVHAKFTDDGSVELYHNNSKKFETKSDGVSVTGEIAVTGAIDAEGSAEFAGHVKSTNGNGSAFLGATSGTGVAINDSGNTTKIELNYDGSADFAGAVKIGGTAAANQIDEYEEGTFTPSYGTGVTSPSYNIQQGHYVRVGRLVSFSIGLRADGGTPNNSALVITGLPFTTLNSANSEGGAFLVYNANIISSNVTPTFYMPVNTVNIEVYTSDGTASWTGNTGNDVMNRVLRIRGQYYTS